MKKQYLVAAGAAVTVILLFVFGRTSEPKKAAEVNKALISFDISHYIDSVKQGLPREQSSLLQKIEQEHPSDSIAVISKMSHLAGFWRDSARMFEPYAFYLIQSAKLENSEKSLTFAAHLMLENMRMQQEPVKLEWLAKETIDLFERAIKLNPNNDDLRIGLGSAYIFGRGRSGDSESTMKGIQELLAVSRKDTNNLKAELVLGVGGMISGQFDKARDRFLKIVTKEPTNLEAIAYLADTYAALGEKHEAIKWYTVSKKLANNPHYSKEVDERIRQLK